MIVILLLPILLLSSSSLSSLTSISCPFFPASARDSFPRSKDVVHSFNTWNKFGQQSAKLMINWVSFVSSLLFSFLFAYNSHAALPPFLSLGFPHYSPQSFLLNFHSVLRTPCLGLLYAYIYAVGRGEAVPWQFWPVTGLTLPITFLLQHVRFALQLLVGKMCTVSVRSLSSYFALDVYFREDFVAVFILHRVSLHFDQSDRHGGGWPLVGDNVVYPSASFRLQVGNLIEGLDLALEVLQVCVYSKHSVQK